MTKKVNINENNFNGFYIATGILLFISLIIMIYNFYFGLAFTFLSSVLLIYLYYLVNGKDSYLFKTKIKLTKNLVKYGCILLLILSIVSATYGMIRLNPKDKNYENYIKQDGEKFDVEIKIEFEENILFNRYDVNFSVYDINKNLAHGKNQNFQIKLPNGEHNLNFTGNDNSNTVTLKVDGNTKVTYKVSCHTNEIKVSETSLQNNLIKNIEEEKIEEVTEPTTSTAPTTTTITTTTTTTTTSSKSKSVSYSTNDADLVKAGNTGVYAYKSRGGSVDVYWIIDFDKKYVYNFFDGNGDDTCDKVKIVSGNLNDYVKITWHDGKSKWSYGLHFKYKNQPDHLIVQDNDGFDYDYYATNLVNALLLRDTKKIKSY